MGYGITIEVRGERACFTRPEMKAERVSYDVITPSAARGILEAIFWKPPIKWIIDGITVLNPIKFGAIRVNELGSKIPGRNISTAMKGGDINLHQYINDDRQQRTSLFLKDAAYLIDAHFEVDVDKCGQNDNEMKFYNMFLRRARNGQCYHRPYLGCREYPAMFSLVEGEKPKSSHKGTTIDLGWMLYDLDYENDFKPIFYRPVLEEGRIDVKLARKEVVT